MSFVTLGRSESNDWPPILAIPHSLGLLSRLSLWTQHWYCLDWRRHWLKDVSRFPIQAVVSDHVESLSLHESLSNESLFWMGEWGPLGDDAEIKAAMVYLRRGGFPIELRGGFVYDLGNMFVKRHARYREHGRPDQPTKDRKEDPWTRGDKKASHAFLLCADEKTANRADMTAVAIALWRIRMWEGAGWEDWGKAAKGQTSPEGDLPTCLKRKALPASVAALRQEWSAKLKQRWRKRWCKSLRSRHFGVIDKSAPSAQYLKLIDHYKRKQASIISQFHTNHAPLNQTLFRIKRVDSPACPHCGGITVETICHYILDCPHYALARHTL
ncbi:hypothetical protein FIBSPDRAFT_944955 [Athelia psychrophila]|uniref:Reverse transcriptase zinc-binding domain-containing protein n=1 Tax=Athelia psychrophila TaxID=1759441 RepID=A0A166U818_9AGAM|nr:hypothetical protein FIBSPDRAFT_944955 [Fibularhizoctonia sp. CBS 109695]